MTISKSVLLYKDMMFLNKYSNHYHLSSNISHFIKRSIQTTINKATELATAQEIKHGLPSKVKRKKPKRPAFMKNLFVGKFDPEILSYPQVLEKENYDLLHDMVQPIERFFKEEVDSAKIDREAQIPQKTLDALKGLGLYGLQIPEEYGGLGFSATEYARIEEIIALDGSISVTLAAHQATGLKAILLYGTPEQKEKYLPRLADGSWTAALCLSEPSSGSDVASIEATAHLAPDETHYILDGSKCFVSNGATADVMTVFARTVETSKSGLPASSNISAFIVERNFGGVTSGKPADMMGIRGSNVTTVDFDRTCIPLENLLGKSGDGFKIALALLTSRRYAMGSACAGKLKHLMAMAVEHVLTRKQFKHTLSEFALIKEKFAIMASNIYAMEAMTYLTTGWMDRYEDQDCVMEAAAIKIFSSEKGWQHTSDCLQIMGGQGYMKDYPYERILRDHRSTFILDGTNEILRLLIGYGGLQHAGREIATEVRKNRNPLLFPKYILNKVWNKLMTDRMNPRLDLRLYQNLHPRLSKLSDLLETNVKRLAPTVEYVLSFHGKDISLPQNQVQVGRLANAVIELYAITAVLSRLSRSYCLGHPNADHEADLAVLFINDAHIRLLNLMADLDTGPVLNRTAYMNDAADVIFHNNGYCASHPLFRHLF